MFFKELLSNNDIDKIWNVLSKKDNRLKNLDKHIIQSSVDEWLINFEHTRCINDLNLEKLHTAMKVVKECSNIPKHSIIESMQEVLSPQALSEIIFLYNEYNDNGFFFMGIAQIRKALVTGTISSYTIGKNLEIFNQKYEYNLSQLTTYLNGVEDLYNRYTDTLNDIEQALNSK